MGRGQKSLLMESFYRTMRKKHDILMDGKDPIGGKWNYDSQNRESINIALSIKEPFKVECDSLTAEVKLLVAKFFPSNFGDIEPFFVAVKEDALQSLQNFIAERLSLFGKYQDAMVEGEPWLYHSHISFYLNSGLLSAKECILASLKAYYENTAPLNSVEGFIRQIIGWREFVRGIYWLKMPEYETVNFLEAKQALPNFYWDAKTHMNCLKQCVSETKANAYAHHIQRLMVLGNFALIAGVNPKSKLLVLGRVHGCLSMGRVTECLW